MAPLPMLSEEDEDEVPAPSADDLLDWQPHIRREPDPRQPLLPL
jgi:hypothetical protein